MNSRKPCEWQGFSSMIPRHSCPPLRRHIGGLLLTYKASSPIITAPSYGNLLLRHWKLSLPLIGDWLRSHLQRIFQDDKFVLSERSLSQPVMGNHLINLASQVFSEDRFREKAQHAESALFLSIFCRKLILISSSCYDLDIKFRVFCRLVRE